MSRYIFYIELYLRGRKNLFCLKIQSFFDPSRKEKSRYETDNSEAIVSNCGEGPKRSVLTCKYKKTFVYTVKCILLICYDKILGNSYITS